jgi:hypothetical protein
MLEMTSKWFTNTLAKKSIQTNDFILCNDGKQLYIIGYGEITKGGKNTYNYIVKDASTQIIVREGENAYLDALTKIILGASPKANQGEGEGAKKQSKQSKPTNNIVEEYKRLEANLKKAILAFNDFQTLHNITTLKDAQEAQNKAKDARRKEAQSKRRNEEAKILRINKLRKWAKETKRLELLQGLNKQLLEM